MQVSCAIREGEGEGYAPEKYVIREFQNHQFMQK